MGNAISPYCCQLTSSSIVKLIFYGGKTRVVSAGKASAGKIMFEFPDHMVCHADSFFIGHPIPVLDIDDELIAGETYFVLPLDCFTNNVLSASSLATLRRSISSGSKPAAVNFKECPFEHVKGTNGRVLIKVRPEFIIKLLTRDQETGDEDSRSLSPSHGFLCSTPELKKHYDQMVGSKDNAWSPKLETITEYKIRYSPCRFIGFERKQGEAEC
ncbi:unnamed protein product [Coffea canephora]|uniref:DUF4228 domain protein n=1 Tax=Coffea canephora TaxID=49390 RepID=A0A068UJG6_COFCA|nr:unnamed protein product [Coffea canephora]